MKIILYLLFIFFIQYFSFTQTITTFFPYTGSIQNWTVPPCVSSVSVIAAGANGGGANGGYGATISVTIPVIPGQVLQIVVGGSGTCPAAGYNGGANGGNANTNANRACGGGGATDIRISPYGLSNRIIVASGGGGMGGGTVDAIGGSGGCVTGVNGATLYASGGSGGGQFSGGIGGTSWAGGNVGANGSLGLGGIGATDPCYNFAPGGGGGGGYYGGGGGGSDCFFLAPFGGAGGGGGSSLIPASGTCSQGINNGPGFVSLTYTIVSVTAVAANTGPYCAGSSIQLNGTGGTSYSWTGPNGFTSNLQNPTIPNSTAANAGTYTLTTSNAGCNATGTTTVTVNPIATVNAGIDQTICAGGTVTLSGTIGGSAAVGTWSASSGSFSSSTSMSAVYTPTITSGTITLTLTTDDPSGPCPFVSDQVEILVNPLPLVDAGTDSAVCAGAEVILMGSGTGLMTWSNNVVSGTPFIPTATATYTLTSNSALGCTNSDQVVVTINPIPNVNAGTDISICAGQNIILNATGASSYAWSNSIVNGIPFIAITGTYSYTVTGTSAFGCINTDAISVVVSEATTPTFNQNITSGCVPLTVEFTNTSPNIASCTWEFGNGTQVTGPGSVSATFDQASCFDVTLTTTAFNGCVSSYSAIDLICTDALPLASFIQSTAAISELNSTVYFSNTSTGASSYIWNFGDSTASVFTEDPTHTFSTDDLGDFATMLIAISSDGCIDTAYSIVTIYEELIYYIPNTFTPDGNYSNPTFLPIFTSGYDPYDFTLIIYNRWGEVVFESHDVKIGWDGTYGSGGEIESVQDGTYSWKIEFKTTESDERKKFFGHVNVLR